MTTAVSPSRRAVTYGQATIFRNLRQGGSALQQRIALIGHSNTATSNSLDKVQLFSAQQAGETYGFGSMLHEMALQCFPTSGDGVQGVEVWAFPLADGTTPADGSIAPTGSATAKGTYHVKIGSLITASFELDIGATVADAVAALVAAINTGATTGPLRMPVTAVDNLSTSCDLTCKWGGLTGNEIGISVVGPSAGITWGITPMANGAGDPAIDAALLNQFGSTWFTQIVNGLGPTTAALDALSDFNEGRWLPLENRPVATAMSVSTETTFATAITVPDGRGTDRTNSQLSVPGSPTFTWAIGARAMTRVANVANGFSPATDYVGQILSGIEPGTDAEQWTSDQRDTAVKSGMATTELRDGQVVLSDTVTMYHPTGDDTPAYRYVNDIVKLQQMINDLRNTFDTAEWKAAPLIPDDQATTDPNARKPKAARTRIYGLIDSWALSALISNPDAAKLSVTAAIDMTFNRRLNLGVQVQVSGNAGVISADLFWGFYYGEPVTAA